MNDFFMEDVVEGRKNKKTVPMLILVGCVCVISLVIAWLYMCESIVVTIITAILFFALLKQRDLEYEYVYTNTEIEIVKILNKNKRKVQLSFDLKDVRVIAPIKSVRIDNERQKSPKLRITNYTSGQSLENTYCFIFDSGNTPRGVMMELAPKAKEHIRSIKKNEFYED